MGMNPEDIILSEISQSQKTNSVAFHFYEVPRVFEFIETESRMVTEICSLFFFLPEIQRKASFIAQRQIEPSSLLKKKKNS